MKFAATKKRTATLTLFLALAVCLTNSVLCKAGNPLAKGQDVGQEAARGTGVNAWIFPFCLLETHTIEDPDPNTWGSCRTTTSVYGCLPGGIRLVIQDVICGLFARPVAGANATDGKTLALGVKTVSSSNSDGLGKVASIPLEFRNQDEQAAFIKYLPDVRNQLAAWSARAVYQNAQYVTVPANQMTLTNGMTLSSLRNQFKAPMMLEIDENGRVSDAFTIDAAGIHSVIGLPSSLPSLQFANSQQNQVKVRTFTYLPS